MPLENFSFVVEGLLAGCAHPAYFSRDLRGGLLELAEHGIGAIVSLTEDRLPAGALQEAGIRYLHLPIRDFTPPSQEQIDRFVEFVEAVEEAKAGAVVVHCFAGQGRTGTMLAAWLVYKGARAAEAVEKVRELRPGSIETEKQVAAVAEYEKRLRGF
ncbi:MAG: dual specificity protein phosphatase 23 [Sumerlaeia bacterium]